MAITIWFWVDCDSLTFFLDFFLKTKKIVLLSLLIFVWKHKLLWIQNLNNYAIQFIILTNNILYFIGNKYPCKTNFRYSEKKNILYVIQCNRYINYQLIGQYRLLIRTYIHFILLFYKSKSMIIAISQKSKRLIIGPLKITTTVLDYSYYQIM